MTALADLNIDEIPSSVRAEDIGELLNKVLPNLLRFDEEFARPEDQVTSTEIFWTNYKITLPYNSSAALLAIITDTFPWVGKDGAGNVIIYFFGEKRRAKLAVDMLRQIHTTMHNVTERFKATKEYRETPHNRRSAYKRKQYEFTRKVDSLLEGVLYEKWRTERDMGIYDKLTRNHRWLQDMMRKRHGFVPEIHLMRT